MQDCQLAVYKPNPRQYVATISQVRLVPVTRVAGEAPCVRLTAGKTTAGSRSAQRVLSE